MDDHEQINSWIPLRLLLCTFLTKSNCVGITFNTWN